MCMFCSFDFFKHLLSTIVFTYELKVTVWRKKKEEGLSDIELQFANLMTK